jgi:hypothetical protein
MPQPRIPQWSQRDTDQLTWYFGLGQTVFERSTFGGMLERAEMFGGVKHAPVAREPVYDSRTGECIIGHESALSARPTAELRPEAGYVPDDGQLHLYAVVSSRVMRVERLHAQSAVVLEVLFGDAGQRWTGNAHGRLGALFYLTAKGRAMCSEAAKAAGALDMTSAQRIESMCAVQAVQPKPERAQQLAFCLAQAEMMELHARATWHQVRSGEQ